MTRSWWEQASSFIFFFFFPVLSFFFSLFSLQNVECVLRKQASSFLALLFLKNLTFVFSRFFPQVVKCELREQGLLRLWSTTRSGGWCSSGRTRPEQPSSPYPSCTQHPPSSSPISSSTSPPWLAASTRYVLDQSRFLRSEREGFSSHFCSLLSSEGEGFLLI